MRDGMLPHAVLLPRTDDKPDDSGPVHLVRWQETAVRGIAMVGGSESEDRAPSYHAVPLSDFA